LSAVNTNSDFRQQQVTANRNRLGLSNLCKQMLQAITAMDHEVKTCGEVLYEGSKPWIQLLQQLNEFNIHLEKCERKPNAIIQAFTGDAYVGLAVRATL